MIIDRAAMGWNEALGLGVFRSVKSRTARAGLRRQTYVAGLRQAEEFWLAARAASTLVSPILRYYALMQAGQAVAAGSTLDNSSWQARGGHGLTLSVPDIRADQRLKLEDVLVKAEGNGMAAQAVASALRTPLLAEPAPLGALIGALRNQPLFLRSSGQIRLPLTVSVQEKGSRASSSIVSLLISDGLPESFLKAMSAEELSQAELREELAHYPSLRNLPEWQTATLERDWMKQSPGWLRLRYSHEQFRPWSELDPYFDEWTTAGLGGRQEDAYVYPSVGANEKAQHPLMTWYLVMYAFSMLARYYGAAWRRLLDKDESVEAALLEHFIEEKSGAAWTLLGGVLKNQELEDDSPIDM